jgi:hypothetical protein
VKYLKKFEIFENGLKPIRNQLEDKLSKLNTIKSKIMYDYIMYFDSEKDFDDYCMDMNDVADLDSVLWDYIPENVIYTLDLHQKYPELTEFELKMIVLDILNEVNLDDMSDVRKNGYDILLKKLEYPEEYIASIKYNL